MALNVDAAFREVVLPGAAMDLDFTNDGALLACANSIEGDTGAPVHLIRTADQTIIDHRNEPSARRGRGVAFVQDGQEIVYLYENQHGDTSLYRSGLASRTQTLLKLYDLSSRNHGIVRDHQARWFAVLGNHIEIWDARASTVIRTLPGAASAGYVQAAFSKDGERIYIYGIEPSTVIGYAVESGQELGRWSAPTAWGAQVAVSRDERFLIAVGEDYRGLFLHDLATGQRILRDKAEIREFNEEAIWRPLAFSFDSSLLLSLRGQVACFRLPEIEGFNLRKTGVDPGLRGDASASAWDAPVVAFATREDMRVRWFSLVAV